MNFTRTGRTHAGEKSRFWLHEGDGEIGPDGGSKDAAPVGMKT
jgi:hypothetical protein